jgi:hypothetical protein
LIDVKSDHRPLHGGNAAGDVPAATTPSRDSPREDGLVDPTPLRVWAPAALGPWRLQGERLSSDEQAFGS